MYRCRARPPRTPGRRPRTARWHRPPRRRLQSGRPPDGYVLTSSTPVGLCPLRSDRVSGRVLNSLSGKAAAPVTPSAWHRVVGLAPPSPSFYPHAAGIGGLPDPESTGHL